MDIRKINEMRNQILAEVEKEFIDEMVPAKLVESTGNDVPILNIILEGSDEEIGNAMGEFFFLPSTPGDEIQYFVNLITIYENIPKENIRELGFAVSAINTYVTTGAFAIDYASKSLIYKLVYPLPINADDAVVEDAVDITMGCAFGIVKDYGYLLVEVCEGDRSPESVIEVFADEI